MAGLFSEVEVGLPAGLLAAGTPWVMGLASRRG